ncbi:transcription elongation factor, mitochondrial isoform X2 [Condylostylus longicornis]|nr:transcription elongation factor, mitochondrial isoform X2 [Condylostylus longicornis]
MTGLSKTFNQNDEESVLNVINNSTEKELISLGIAKTRSQRIVAWREVNGQFKNMNDLISINGIGIKIVEKLAHQILNPKCEDRNNFENGKKKTKVGMQYSIPPIPESLRMHMKTCLSLYIGVSTISWTRFELNVSDLCTLTHWNCIDILHKKMHVNDLVEQCLVLINEIPDSDCYVLENPKVAQMAQPGSPPQININIQKSQIIAIISYGLRNRKWVENNRNLSSKSFPNLFFLKRYLHSRLFDTLIGSESVTTSEVILKLIKNHYNVANISSETCSTNIEHSTTNVESKVSIPQDFTKRFQNLDGVKREFLGQSILLALTFIRLCILRCPGSIEKLNHLKRNT